LVGHLLYLLFKSTLKLYPSVERGNGGELSPPGPLIVVVATAAEQAIGGGSGDYAGHHCGCERARARWSIANDALGERCADRPERAGAHRALAVRWSIL
jgi:hypothetical protein